MTFRWLALGASLALLTGCGTPAAPQLPPAAHPFAAQASLRGSLLWDDTITTGTDNKALMMLSFAQGSAPTKGASGKLHLAYGDRTGYFAGKSTLVAFVKLETTEGERSFQHVPLTLARKAGGVQWYSADLAVELKDRHGDVRAVELAFAASDRYGHLKWDSDDGRNYRFERTLKP